MKKTITIGMIVLLIFSLCLGVNAQTKPVWSVVGDGNRDGKVDANDALMALYMGVVKMEGPYYVNGFGVPANQLSEQQLAYYYDATHITLDVTDDGWVNAGDALMILQHAVGKRDSFPKTDLTAIETLTWPTAN